MRSHEIPSDIERTGSGQIVRRETLVTARDSMDALESTARRIEELMRVAQNDADDLRAMAVAQAHAEVWASARCSIKEIESFKKDLIEGSTALAEKLVAQTMVRLLVDVPKEWALMSNVRLLMHQSVVKDAAIFRHCPTDDIASIVGLISETNWEIVSDASLTSGVCAVTCRQGELRADFCGHLDALVRSLEPFAQSERLTPTFTLDRHE